MHGMTETTLHIIKFYYALLLNSRLPSMKLIELMNPGWSSLGNSNHKNPVKSVSFALCEYPSPNLHPDPHPCPDLSLCPVTHSIPASCSVPTKHSSPLQPSALPSHDFHRSSVFGQDTSHYLQAPYLSEDGNEAAAFDPLAPVILATGSQVYWKDHSPSTVPIQFLHFLLTHSCFNTPGPHHPCLLDPRSHDPSSLDYCSSVISLV